MRYLPLLLLVLAGNVSAQTRAWKSDYPEYLAVIAFAPSCERWITKEEIEAAAEAELLRARLKNALPPVPFDAEGVVVLRVFAQCLSDGMSHVATLSRFWPGTTEYIFSPPAVGIVTGSMDKSRLLNAVKDSVYETLTYFLEANQ